jgi:hypothetical protein
MMTFPEFLKKKAQEPQHTQRRERRDEWVAAVDRLINQLRAWLAASDPEQVLEVVPLHFEKGEPNLGVYQVDGLKIGVGDASVQVVPVGRDVVGLVGPRGDSGVRAEGRVDITDGVRKYILYRTLKDGQEKWYALDERFEAAPLDQGRLEVILLDLLS